jgi:hypothetical protein
MYMHFLGVCAMGKVEILENEISQLSSSELAAFREWFLAFDAAVWDGKIEQDAQAGKLDMLAQAALKEFNLGNRTEF